MKEEGDIPRITHIQSPKEKKPVLKKNEMARNSEWHHRTQFKQHKATLHCWLHAKI